MNYLWVIPNISGMTSASRGFTANRLIGMLKAMMKNVCIKTCNTVIQTLRITKNLDVALSDVIELFLLVPTKNDLSFEN
jgi:predicted DNA-binding helix-hairpin-helix protein